MDRRKSVAPRSNTDPNYNRRRTTIRMARPGANMPTAGASENSTAITEELERTEQQITLTLQEIDRNFSQANRVISESIIPLLEKYGEESAKLWSRAGFWKDFLESSVDVKLTAFEENVTMDMENLSLDEIEHVPVATDGNEENRDQEMVAAENKAEHEDEKDHTEQAHAQAKNPLINDSSEHDQDSTVFTERPFNGDLFASTPRRSPLKLASSKRALNNMSNNNMNSPLKFMKNPKLPAFEVQDLSMHQNVAAAPGAIGTESPLVTQTRGGILRHQVLDKNWKIQATPRSKQPRQLNKLSKPTFADHPSDEDDLDVSFEPPKLLSDIFKVTNKGNNANTMSLNESNSLSDISTPQNFQTKLARYAATPKGRADPYLYDDKESSIDFMHGISPPKLNFGHTSSSSSHDMNRELGHHSTSISTSASASASATTNSNKNKSLVDKSRESTPQLVRTPAKLAAESILKNILKDVENQENENVFDSI